jgi:hypothetical protein
MGTSNRRWRILARGIIITTTRYHGVLTTEASKTGKDAIQGSWKICATHEVSMRQLYRIPGELVQSYWFWSVERDFVSYSCSTCYSISKFSQVLCMFMSRSKKSESNYCVLLAVVFKYLAECSHLWEVTVEPTRI